MPAELKRGMDHDLYAFSPIGERPALSWPGGSPVALWVVLYLDYWELSTPEGSHRAPDTQGMWGHVFPDLRTWSYRLHGERIGVFRILDVLSRHGIHATIAAGAEICQRHPALVAECAERGHEIAAHGTHATRMITSRMSEDEERRFISESVDAVTKASGVRPRGWFGQDQGESTRTPRLVAESGLNYLADWPNDDQPYWMTLERPLVSLPLQTELDDMQLLWMRQRPTWSYPAAVEAAASRLATEGAASGRARTLGLGLRSWLFGRPHRIRYLDQTLETLMRRSDVWQASAGSIVSAFSEAVPSDAKRMFEQ